jgi:hypothetical protein
MRAPAILFIIASCAIASAHPGGGLVALSETSVIYPDPLSNNVWLLEKGQAPRAVLEHFHGHWMTRGLDGKLYTEAFQESGGKWSSCAFRLDLPDGKPFEIASREEVGALSFAVDDRGHLVYQEGSKLVVRQGKKTSQYRRSVHTPVLSQVTAYAWRPKKALYFADSNDIRRLNEDGSMSYIGTIEGDSLKPHIWNATETPSIYSLALDDQGRLFAAVPDQGKVYRFDTDGTMHVIVVSLDDWRTTGVATFGKTLFLLESNARYSVSPRVRVMRTDGTIEPFG